MCALDIACALEEAMTSPVKTLNRKLDLAYGRLKVGPLLVDEGLSDARYY